MQRIRFRDSLAKNTNFKANGSDNALGKTLFGTMYTYSLVKSQIETPQISFHATFTPESALPKDALCTTSMAICSLASHFSRHKRTNFQQMQLIELSNKTYILNCRQSTPSSRRFETELQLGQICTQTTKLESITYGLLTGWISIEYSKVKVILSTGFLTQLGQFKAEGRSKSLFSASNRSRTSLINNMLVMTGTLSKMAHAHTMDKVFLL